MSPTELQKCKRCSKSARPTDIKTCSVCCDHYHYQCLGISLENFSKESKQTKINWKCLDCKIPQKRNEKSLAVDVQQVLGNSPSSSASYGKDVIQELKDYIDLKLNEAIDKILLDVSDKIKTENKALCEKVSELYDTVKFVSAQYDDMQKELDSKTKIIDQLQASNLKLLGEMKDVNNKLNVIEQHSRSCNLEIQCVPEHKNENLLSTVKQMTKIISYTINDHEIMNCHRIPKMDHVSSRPRSIIVQLQSPRIRDGILAAVKEYNKLHKTEKLHSGHLGLGDNKQPVYVSEHLSPANRKLHAATRIVAREKKYEFVWIRNGKIFIRKDIHAKAKIVLNEDTLIKL